MPRVHTAAAKCKSCTSPLLDVHVPAPYPTSCISPLSGRPCPRDIPYILYIKMPRILLAGARMGTAPGLSFENGSGGIASQSQGLGEADFGPRYLAAAGLAAQLPGHFGNLEYAHRGGGLAE